MAKKTTPALALVRPERSVAAAKAEGDHARILCDVPRSVYVALQVRLLERRLSMKAYLLERLKADGIG